MSPQISPAERYASDVQHYERADIVRIWLDCYEWDKERQFVRCIDRLLPRHLTSLLDVGCGTGLHTFLWSERGKTVTASDLSSQFQEHILHTYTFPFVRMDVLNCTLTEQYDICFCMAVATILLDEERRFQTFETLRRLVRPGGYVVLVTASNRWPFAQVPEGGPLHCLNRRDLDKLRELGLPIARVFRWSNSPRWLWRSPVGRWLGCCLEEAGFRANLGARQVVLCARPLSQGA